MTRNNDTPYRRKGLSVFLTVLMVLSVVAMSATFVGSVAAINATSPDDLGSETVFSGEQITVNNITQGDEVTLRRVTGTDSEGNISSSTPVRTETADSNNVTFDSTGLDTDEYFLRGNITADEEETRFELVVQELNTEFDDEEIDVDGNTSVTIDSPVRTEYGVNVTADGLDEDDLQDIFGGADWEGDDEVQYEDWDGTNSSDFDGIGEGEYEFDFTVTDTGASDSANITISEAPSEDIEFVDSVVTETEGDVAEIEIDVQESDVAHLVVGSEDSGYFAGVELDVEEDGEYTVLFNSYRAGLTNDTDDLFSLPDNDAHDDISVADTYDENLNGSGDVTTNITYSLPTGDYELRLASTNDMSDGDLDDETDVASMTLEERSIEGVNVHVAPSDDADAHEDVNDLDSVLTESSTIADGDRMVVEVEGEGMFGLIDHLGEDDALDELNTSAGVKNYFYLSMSEAETGVSSPESIPYGDESELVVDADNNSFYVVVDTSNLDGYQDDWNAVFSLGDDYLEEVMSPAVHDDDVEAGVFLNSFTIDEPVAEFDRTNDDDAVQLLPEEDATVSGETNVAPGSELNVQVRLGGSYVETADEVVVQEDGTFSTTLDLSEAEVDDEPSVSVSGDLVDESADGIVVDEIEEPPTDDEIQELEDEIADLEDENAALEDENANLQDTLDGERETISELETQVEDLSDERDSLQSDIDDALDESGADDLDDLVSMADGGDDDDENPAFGPIAALIAILAGGAVAARRRL